MNTQQQIAIYQQENGDIQIEVDLEQDSIWLNQAHRVELFGRDQSVISWHIRNAMVEQEVSAKSNMQKMHNANSARSYRARATRPYG